MKLKVDTLAVFMMWLYDRSKKDFDYVKPLFDSFVEFVKDYGGNHND